MAEESKTSLKNDIRKVTIGIKEPRDITIYPLSLQDQLDLLDRISEYTQTFKDSDFSDITNEQAIEFLKAVLIENLTLILSYVTTEKDRPELRELTNNQFYTLVEIIYEVNFEGVLKNSKNLFQRMKGTMALKQ